MVSQIKKKIQHKLHTICYGKYRKEIRRQEDSYRQWYLLHEDWKREKYPAPDPDIFLFADRAGRVEEKAAGLVTAFFRAHPWVRIAYGDEDCVDRAGRRHSPWFKPQWSPDTLASFNYFGHFFAVHKSVLEDMAPEQWQPYLSDTQSRGCHKLLQTLTEKVTAGEWIRADGAQKAIASLGKVLIHMPGEEQEGGVDSDETEALRQTAESGYGRTAGAEQGAAPCSEETTGQPQSDSPVISVIIPSKDNPHVLEVCLSSLRAHTHPGLPYEIVVVDNGSSEENRAKVQTLCGRYDFRYLYEPMPFNFSRMCNLGAEKSNGAFLLLLNDDMEITDTDFHWMEKLLEKARLPHVGAVGAKLLYPDTDLIQHAGITNLKVGPAHKLMKMHDENSYYHGQNRHVYDMIGVTAACLMVDRRKYEGAGGLYEGMAVSYNDVEFCFALYELGYYNVLRNDVVLYHHESLSRGDDNLSDEKWKRLLQEKEILYERHPSLRGYDPFYSRNLAGISNIYNPDFSYEFEKMDHYVRVKRYKKPEPLQWSNECLIVNVEHYRLERRLEITDRDEVYWIEGWSYVFGMDNCRYQRSLLLHGSRGGIYEVQVLTRYRKDVAAVLPGQINVELAGFVCRIPKQALPEDTYGISVLARDRCSGQRLYRRTEHSFVI